MKISMGEKRPEKRTCIVCGKTFYAKGNQKTCGFLCSDSPQNMKRQKRKSLEKLLNKIR